MSGFDHFNFIGPIYDLIFGRRANDAIVARTGVKPNHRLLDVGGGTGRVTVLFKPMTRQVIIADSARKMLKEAQVKGVTCT